MKTNSVMEHTFANGVHTWKFADGKTLVVDQSKLPTNVIAHATMDRIKSKIGDAAAISRNPETGESATVADKRAAMQQVADQLAAGNWNSGTRETSNSAEAEAIAAVRKIAVAKVKVWLKTLKPAQRAAVMHNSAVKKEYDRLVEARIRTAGLDADEIFDTMPE